MNLNKSLKINYEKRKNGELFKSFQNETLTNLSEVQNYVPVYNKFFDLNETNYNSINLNHEWYISKVEKQTDYNLYKCEIKNSQKDKTKSKNLFFKMAPLIDPFKLIVGKYDFADESLYNLPKYNSTTIDVNEKILDQNNTAYVDGLFSYCSSLLNYNYNFVHGIEFYGSFLAIKKDFKFNIIDDIEFVNKSEFFNKNKNILFKVYDENNRLRDLTEVKKLKPIKIEDDGGNTLNISAKSINNELFENVFADDEDVSGEPQVLESGQKIEDEHISLETLKEFSIDLSNLMNDDRNNKSETIQSVLSCSSCSSRTSYTSDDTENMMEDFDEMNGKPDSNASLNSGKITSTSGYSDDSEEYSDSDYDDDERIDVTLDKFPVQIICMENCENTFDNLIANDELEEKEWFSAFMQIIMTLVTYQKVFLFTHNDLHTNNIMYNKTDKKFLYYKFNNKYYKVPTYGRIYKIIDFGRGIYKFNGKQFCSDCFKNGEDAATQYNFEPYFNDKKPRLEPNSSFDLCRLACSIWDYVIDDMDEISNLKECSPLVQLIVEWCLDDNGVNILYKNNGQERYPDFKLYKMIARNVHHHVPYYQLERKEFKKYVVSTVPNNENIMDIDAMPAFL
uniref:Protein kinase domain-containing protein n=1 Tax=viral metagenome TaxID=1070528 RepID=A0A6C0DG92_9ZZZZ